MPILPKQSELTSMVEILSVRGAFIDVKCWDYDDDIITGVFAGSELHEPAHEGDVFLVGMSREGNLWKLDFAIGPYGSFPINDDGDEIEIEN